MARPGTAGSFSVGGRSRRLNSPGVGLFGEPWPIGTTALWAAVLLAVCLVVYLF